MKHNKRNSYYLWINIATFSGNQRKVPSFRTSHRTIAKVHLEIHKIIWECPSNGQEFLPSNSNNRTSFEMESNIPSDRHAHKSQLTVEVVLCTLYFNYRSEKKTTFGVTRLIWSIAWLMNSSCWTSAQMVRICASLSGSLGLYVGHSFRNKWYLYRSGHSSFRWSLTMFKTKNERKLVIDRYMFVSHTIFAKISSLTCWKFTCWS